MAGPDGDVDNAADVALRAGEVWKAGGIRPDRAAADHEHLARPGFGDVDATGCIDRDAPRIVQAARDHGGRRSGCGGGGGDEREAHGSAGEADGEAARDRHGQTPSVSVPGKSPIYPALHISTSWRGLQRDLCGAD